MKPLRAIFRRRERSKGKGIRARFLEVGMTAEMADLLCTMHEIQAMPPAERHTTAAGRALWMKWLAGCAKVDAEFEAFAQNRAFDTFRSELKRLAAMAGESGQSKAGGS